MRKIYVLANSKLNTGGSESLHQLVHYLRANGEDAYIYYINDNYKVDSKFDIYNYKIAESLQDRKENIIIAPEVYANFFHDINYAKKIIWWLSWDYYFSESADEISKNLLSKYHLPFFLRGLVKFVGKKTNGYRKYPKSSFYEPIDLKNRDIEHFYNSKYIKLKLEKLGIKVDSKNYLCGPLAEDFFYDNDYKNKENIIIYNPSKGRSNTTFIINKAKEMGYRFQFVALENLTRDEIKKELLRAKVYVDFGEFPGPERIPREAAMCKCLIITSKNGAAENDFDVPIPNEFKFDNIKENYAQILFLIQSMLDNYDHYVHNYDNYRAHILTQKLNFTNFAKILSK